MKKLDFPTFRYMKPEFFKLILNHNNLNFGSVLNIYFHNGTLIHFGADT